MEIKCAHSEADIRCEAAYMVFGGGITLEKAMRLFLAGSALIMGGKYDDAEAARVRGIIESGADAWQAAANEINAAFRALEIIVDAEGDRGGDKSDYKAFSPEWLATIASTAAAMANDTMARIMTEYSLVSVFHLIAAHHRRNGGITRRPLDRDSVLAALAKAREHINGGKGHQG